MGSQAEEVDWDRLDKNKFFVYGAGMFSGVTLTLYPLSVIKTKQMTLPGISGGFQGVKQTASTIMRTEGAPGFYRGFGTVMFGTIPARSVYLTTLEWTKSEVAKVVADLGLTGPAAAGVANFVGGAVASLATQSVTVPIDVISQKQMVHGDETVVARHQHSRGAASLPSTLAMPSTASSSAAGPGGLATGAAAGGAGSRGQGPGVGRGLEGPPALVPTASSPTALPPPSSSAAGTAVPSPPSSSATPTASRGASTAATAHSAPSRSSTALAAAPSSTTLASSEAPSRTLMGVSTSGRAPHPQQQVQSVVVRRIGAVNMVRLILKEEGIGGLYRGFGASVATFVPSSAVWWGAYGTYQKLIWVLRHRSPRNGAVVVASGGVQQQQQPLEHSTTEVVAVQTLSSVLAGCTSGLLTTPVDLVKTRIQVSYKHDGATPTFGEVARQILREDGAGGFLRGAVPRMLNASLWGTCMVTVYEYLKRTCAKVDA